MDAPVGLGLGDAWYSKCDPARLLYAGRSWFTLVAQAGRLCHGEANWTTARRYSFVAAAAITAGPTAVAGGPVGVGVVVVLARGKFQATMQSSVTSVLRFWPVGA